MASELGEEEEEGRGGDGAGGLYSGVVGEGGEGGGSCVSDHPDIDVGLREAWCECIFNLSVDVLCVFNKRACVLPVSERVSTDCPCAVAFHFCMSG